MRWLDGVEGGALTKEAEPADSAPVGDKPEDSEWQVEELASMRSANLVVTALRTTVNHKSFLP
ncbi:MAG: hypothetical protein NVSMB62_26270 [Acidobacteriaceae bacterium]